MMLRELAGDLWVTERPLRFMGLEVGARMTTLRLGDGSLLLHSPVPLDSELRRELDVLGPVRFAIAPNRFHHLWAGEVRAAYPDAKLWVAPGVEKKRADLVHEGVLGDEPPAAWAGQLEQVPFRGFPLANEVVLFHPASRSLICADLAFHIGPRNAAPARLMARLSGGYGRVSTTPLERFGIRDRAAARASLERILAFDFERLIVSHGEVQETGGREALRTAYAWLLAASS